MLTFSDSVKDRSETLPAQLAIEGGYPVRDIPWPTYEKGDVFISEEDELAAIQAVLRRRYYRYDARKLGETFNGRLEERLCEYFGCRYALACTSGTAAIALALLALDLPPNSPIACSAFTFSATPSAIMLAGHRPVLVDCDENLHVDLNDLKRVIDEGAKAVVVVHMRGFACDIEGVCKLAAEAGVPLVEDAVPVLGVKSGGRYLGTFGKFGAFSTQADKPINTGEGGFIITDDPEAYARAVVFCGAYEGRLARHFGPSDTVDVDEREHPVFAWRMDEIRAALAEGLLQRLPKRISAHRKNYDYVAEKLEGLPQIWLRKPSAPGAYLGQSLNFRLEGASPQQCIWFAQALTAEGVDARAFVDQIKPNARSFWNWRFLVGNDPEKAKAKLPQAGRYIAETIDIPLSPNLSTQDADHLVAAVRKVLLAMPPLTSQAA